MCRGLFHTHLGVGFLSWNSAESHHKLLRKFEKNAPTSFIYSKCGQIIQIIKYPLVYLQLFVTQESSGNSMCAGFDGKAGTTVANISLYLGEQNLTLLQGVIRGTACKQGIKVHPAFPGCGIGNACCLPSQTNSSRQKSCNYPGSSEEMSEQLL